jgi:hypothetical protein
VTWVDEREPFPAFLETLEPRELVTMRHEAIRVGDDITAAAVDRELKRRDNRPEPSK